MVNITTTEAKLFAIRCGINQVVGIPNIKHIVIITDSLYTAKRIFKLLLHLYQIYSAAISQELREFFRRQRHQNFQLISNFSMQIILEFLQKM